MLNKINLFFEKYILGNETSSQPTENNTNTAIAALMIEMVHIDNHVKPEELRHLKEVLVSSLNVAPSQVDSLILLAQEELDKATDYFQFTSLINARFAKQQKLNMIRQLWKLAMIDGSIDSNEEHYVRKIADLLFVPHSQFIKMKLDVAAERS